MREGNRQVYIECVGCISYLAHQIGNRGLCRELWGAGSGGAIACEVFPRDMQEGCLVGLWCI